MPDANDPNAKDQVAAKYGEGDIEAGAMTKAADGKLKPDDAPVTRVPPTGAFVPGSGTTQTDVAENLREKANRESKS